MSNNNQFMVENSVDIKDKVVSLKIPQNLIKSFKFNKNDSIVCTVVDGVICITKNPNHKIIPPIVIKK